MKINVCYHLVTRQMEKTSLIFSFIGWVMLLEIEKLTFSVLCGSKKLQTNSIMKKMLISPANFSIYLRDWVRVHFNCSTVTWQTAVVPQGWSETCCHLSTFAKGSCRGICSPPGFSVQAFEKGSSLPLFLSWAFCQLWGSFLPLLHTSFRKRKVLLFHNSVLLVCAFKFCFWYFTCLLLLKRNVVSEYILKWAVTSLCCSWIWNSNLSAVMLSSFHPTLQLCDLTVLLLYLNLFSL